jgi:hypothetical protein
VRTSRLRACAVPLGAAAAAAAAAAVGLAVLHRTGGHDLGPLARCWFNAATGLQCPFCGGLRCLAALSEGHLTEALSLNLLVTLVVPLAAGIWLRRMVFALRGLVVDQPRTGDRGFAVVCVVSLAFAVVRNTPYGAWLAP